MLFIVNFYLVLSRSPHGDVAGKEPNILKIYIVS